MAAPSSRLAVPIRRWTEGRVGDPVRCLDMDCRYRFRLESEDHLGTTIQVDWLSTGFQSPPMVKLVCPACGRLTAEFE